MIQVKRHIVIPDFMQIRVMAPQAVAAAVSWWLSGGISAANAIGVYQPKEAASYAASKSNLANPGTYDATDGVGGASAWASGTGWTFNGTNNIALQTGIYPPAGYSALVRFSGATDTSKPYLFGAYDGTRRFLLAIGTNFVYYYGSGFTSGSAKQAAGVLGLKPTRGYLNGAEDATLSGTYTGSLSNDLWLGGANGITAASVVGSIQAIAIYDTTLTAPQVAAVSTAMALL